MSQVVRIHAALQNRREVFGNGLVRGSLDTDSGCWRCSDAAADQQTLAVTGKQELYVYTQRITGNICEAVHCTARTLERIQVLAALCTHGRTELKFFCLAVKKAQGRWLLPHTAGWQAGRHERPPAAADSLSLKSTAANEACAS